MKHIDIPDDVPVQINDNVVTYTTGGYHYLVRFPAKPASATLSTTERNGRTTVTLGRLDKAVLTVHARASVCRAIFTAVGGQLPDAQ